MGRRRIALGLDFGTLSGRALLVDVTNGREIATVASDYAHGVIDEVLPGTRVKLGPDWALQDPNDYIAALRRVVPAVIREASIKPQDIISVGVDFTGCTLLVVDKKNRPLCTLPRFRRNPHAWAKLWKSHSAQPQADRINALARRRGEKWLDRCGGKVSSEWFFPKVLQTLEEAPEVYEAADRFIEGADWLVQMLTGNERRSSSVAGFKANFSPEGGYPSPGFLAKLNPKLRNVVKHKMATGTWPVGTRAGEITPEMAALTGLCEGTPVATGILDGHAGVPGCGVVAPGRMALIMGSSGCHMALGRKPEVFEGLCGAVLDGAIPGYYCFEAGQSGFGDILAWFVDNCVPAELHSEARKKKVTVHQVLEAKAKKLRPGQSGLLCLDWHNGNRTVLVDANLSGLHVGMTLTTRPEEIYRALIESIAFGTRKIIDTFTGTGIAVKEIVACGGLTKNEMLMQIFADATGRPIKVSGSEQTCALGAAILGAVAAGAGQGGYGTVQQAAAKMTRLGRKTYKPSAEYHNIYCELYREYEALHDYLGRGANEVMHRLKAIKAREIEIAERKKR